MSALLDDIAQRITGGEQENVGIGAAVVKFDAGNDGVLVVDATAKPAKVSTTDRAADCTIKIAAPFLMKAVSGEMPCGEAFMKFVRGVEGRPGLAVQIQPFIRKVAAKSRAQ
jgi:putative sterol carrier protein